MTWWVWVVVLGTFACGEPQRPTTVPIANAVPVDAPQPDAPPVVPDPVHARVVLIEMAGSDAIVTLDRGSTDGIAKHWQIALVDERDKQLAEGVLIRVDKHTTVIKLHASVDEIYASPVVKLWTDQPVDPPSPPSGKIDL